MIKKTPITVAYGDGIGPEIMNATLSVLEAAGAAIAPEVIEVGEKLYRRGITSGIDSASWVSLRKTRVFLKAPITTPQGGGVKSLNVTIRKTLGLYANVRPCRAYVPYVRSNFPGIDIVVVRENEEDLYAGVEYRSSQEMYEALKIITQPGCEKIIRYAFEYAKSNGRRKLTCITKDNIMKFTDGLFHRIFDAVAKEYPDLQTDHLIVDIGMARVATVPHLFDVIVAPNLYGDIVSDMVAEVAGSVGLAPSANIGDTAAMFEAIHGSAPAIAGQNIANPSGLLISACQMLSHIGQGRVAERIHNAWLRTLEEGVHTSEIFVEGKSKEKVGTKEFAEAVIERFDTVPSQLELARYSKKSFTMPRYVRALEPKSEIVGVDLVIAWRGTEAEVLAAILQKICPIAVKLVTITNRGVKVWPEGFPETLCVDAWRCRFAAVAGKITQQEIVTLMHAITKEQLDCNEYHALRTFDGVVGYTLGQGE